MKTGLILFLAIGLFLLSSCDKTDYAGEIETVEHLLLRIDTAQDIHSRIDTNGITEAGRKFKQKFAFVQSEFELSGDTLNRPVALLISNYRDLRKPYANFLDLYSANAKELEFSKKQLIDLRHDLEHNLLDTNFVRRMVTSEKEATNTVVNETKKLSNGRQAMIDKNNLLEPKIDSVITLLKNKK